MPILVEQVGKSDLVAFAGGEAAVHSAVAPDKDGPNEDAAALLPLDQDRGILAVADGLGGRPSGENASGAILRALRAALKRNGGSADGARSAILDGIEAGNRAVIESGTGAATTLCVVELDGAILRPYHVGDSGILVVGQRGRVKLKTVAHSPTGYAEEAGLLDSEEAMHHDDRHLISNIVGAPDMRIEMGSPLRLARRDTVLLATDGLFDNLRIEEIVGIIRAGPLAKARDALVLRAGERMRKPVGDEPSKPDDLTFILFRPALSVPSGSQSG